MRVKIRRELDTDKPINLKKLSPIDKIKAGIITQWKTTDFYRRNRQRKEEAFYVEKMRKDENVKSYLLALIYKELSRNSTLADKNKVCESIIIEVNQQNEDSLKRLFPNLFDGTGEPHKDFLPFEITRVAENADIRRAFSNMPILLRCSKKQL